MHWGLLLFYGNTAQMCRWASANLLHWKCVIFS